TFERRKENGEVKKRPCAMSADMCVHYILRSTILIKRDMITTSPASSSGTKVIDHHQKGRYDQDLTTYNGGKNGNGTYQQIINLIPPHKIYIEPFVGSGGIYKRKLLAP